MFCCYLKLGKCTSPQGKIITLWLHCLTKTHTAKKLMKGRTCFEHDCMMLAEKELGPNGRIQKCFPANLHSILNGYFLLYNFLPDNIWLRTCDHVCQEPKPSLLWVSDSRKLTYTLNRKHEVRMPSFSLYGCLGRSSVATWLVSYRFLATFWFTLVHRC